MSIFTSGMLSWNIPSLRTIRTLFPTPPHAMYDFLTPYPALFFFIALVIVWKFKICFLVSLPHWTVSSGEQWLGFIMIVSPALRTVPSTWQLLNICWIRDWVDILIIHNFIIHNFIMGFVLGLQASSDLKKHFPVWSHLDSNTRPKSKQNE